MKRSRLPTLPPRPADGHKGTFGRVLIVGGSPAMPGAPVLSGRAALRCGSGLVQVAIADLAHHATAASCPELIGLTDAGKLPALLAAARAADVLAVGPGWGVTPTNRRTLLALLELDTAMVVDADGLNLFATLDKRPGVVAPKAPKTGPGTVRLLSNAKLVLTPHPGEMKRLAAAFDLGEFDASEPSRIRVAGALANLTNGVALLKGSRTVVTDGNRVYVNATGDSSLAKAGTGDVLTGIIASLIGQGMEPFEAACLGAHLHGRAGEVAGKRLGQRGVLASDVIAAMPEAFRSLSR